MEEFFKGRFQECLVGKGDLKKELAKVLTDWKWDGTIDSLLEWWFKSEHYIDERILQKIDTLKKKGIICCFATNQEKYRNDYMKKKMGFDKIFDKIFSSAEIGHKKPSQEFFNYILRDLGANMHMEASNLLYFDNEQKNIQAAISSGIKSHLYINFEDFNDYLEQHL